MSEINIKRPGQILEYVDTKDHLLELFNYITNFQQENQQLKECIKTDSDKIHYWVDKSEQYKSVLDEIREQLKKIKPDLDFEPWSIYKVSGDKLFDLLQILDKAGSNE